MQHWLLIIASDCYISYLFQLKNCHLWQIKNFSEGFLRSAYDAVLRSKLSNLCDRSSRGRSRFHLSDTYIPPRVLTLKINRPETVPGRFSRVRIKEGKTNQGSTPNGEDTEKSDHQNQKDMAESNVLTGGKAGIFFSNSGCKTFKIAKNT